MATFDERVNVKGGTTKSISKSIWEITKYKYTTLMRKAPFCWCPYKAYLLADKYVKVDVVENASALIIDKRFYEETIEDARYNKAHAPTFKGTDKEKVRQMYKWIRSKNYVPHVKFARNLFEDGEGDCASFSEAFYVMCKKAKIPVRYIIGWAEGTCHAWNRVKIGKKWYYIDTAMGCYLWADLYDGYTIMEQW